MLKLVPFSILFLFLVETLVLAGTQPPPNILLITLDTTRADHLGCYGYGKGTTPALDRLSGEGARFESAYSSVPITLPSHATMLTGLYPFRTGVRDNGLYRVPSSTQTLAELLHSQHYQTMAIVSSAVLDRTYGLDQGFDLYDDGLQDHSSRSAMRTASEVNGSFFKHATEIKQPYFLWVHYFDPHSPYTPPLPYAQQFSTNRYDGEIAYMDSQIQKLLDDLQSRKLLNHTMIVVAGDHGEGLGAHGEMTHGVFLYDSVLQVPLIFHFPGIIPEGTSVKGLVRLVDVFPTILDYAGFKVPPNLDGVSLREAIGRGASSQDELYQETFLPQNTFGWSSIFGIRTPQWHFILAPKEELYDVLSDPQENRNLWTEKPELAAQLEKSLKAYPFDARISTAPVLSEEQAENLRSLGYFGSPGPSTSDTSWMDPKEGIALANMIPQAEELVHEDKLDEAISLLTRVLKQNPGNTLAGTLLGELYVKKGDDSKAQEAFEMVLSHRKVDYVLYSLATALHSQGKVDAALEALRKAVFINPRYGTAFLSMAETELSLNHRDLCLKILEEAISAKVEDPRLYLMRGRLSAQQKDYQAALKYYQLAVGLDTSYAEAYSEIGLVNYKLHRIEDAVKALQKATSLESKNVFALKALAYIYLHDLADKQRARELYEKVLTLAPNTPDAPQIRNLVKELSPPRE